jgi:hypothetical protein
VEDLGRHRGIGQHDRQHRRHRRVDHPHALGDPGHPYRPRVDPVDVLEGDGRGRDLGPRVGCSERFGGSLEGDVVRGERRDEAWQGRRHASDG